MKRTVVIVAALLALAGCAGSPTSTPRLIAQQVVTALTQRVPTVIPSVVYTAETDPNHLLGRPTGYQSKATFADRRVNPGSATDSSQGSVELGGSVEVFADDQGAQQRMRYIQAIGSSLPAAAEYDYVSGPMLLRLSRLLPPAQAAEYQKALSSVV
jgi:hypothetical protein